jgi:biotin transport system substrate-specific component
MQQTVFPSILTDAFGPKSGALRLAKQVVLVFSGIIALAMAAKISVPVWPSPVPVTMGTFAVLSIAAAYGTRLGLVTVMGYLLIGALGWDVFAGTSAEISGWTYMTGSTGGYLVGYVLATALLGMLAARGWDRSVVWMSLAMLCGNILIYAPGLLWLGHLYGWDKPILTWGLTPFLMGDAFKLLLAAVLFPAVWKAVNAARG